ncbi:MAG: hypothetical protein IPO33_04425 [Saprospiraceae bacterium]|nr:hypothetical protein [Candidatus Brachybacter algidus]
MFRFRRKKTWFEVFLEENTVYHELVEWSKRHTLPGLKGRSIFRVAGELMVHLKKSKIPLRANAISFNFMLASFPFTIFLLTLLPFFHVDNAVDLLKASLATYYQLV